MHGQLGVPVAPALTHDTELAVHGQCVSEHAGGDLYLGEFDHGAQAGLSAMMNGRQNRAGDQVAGLPVNDPVGLLGGMAAHVLVHTGDRGESGVGLAQNVVGTAENLGTVTETAAPDIDEPGVDFGQVAGSSFSTCPGFPADTAR